MEKENRNIESTFSRKVEIKEQRKLKALHENKRSTWSGFGLFGMVGWSVVVPTLCGAALGQWMDEKYHQSFSWTLTLLIIGLITGCIVAWHWIDKEHNDMHQN